MPGLLTLRDFKGPVIIVQCKPCGQRGELDRRALVKQFGGSMRFVDLRRRMAMGFDKMHCPYEQDRCGTQFPVCWRRVWLLSCKSPHDPWASQRLIAIRKGRKLRLDPHWIGGRQCVTSIS